MPTKTSTRKNTRKPAPVVTPEVANEVADKIATAAADMAAQVVEAPAPIDRAALRLAKEKEALASDYRIMAVQAHAEQNYETGAWDTVLEAMEPYDIYQVIYKARSEKGAIKLMDAHLEAYAAHRDEIVNA